MNATRYRLIFNKKTRALCPVAECVVSRSDVASSVGETSAGSAYSGLRIVNKTLSWAIAMALLLPWSVSTFAQTLPTGGQVGVGAGSIQQSGAMMNIHQQSQKMGINWQSYNIGAGNTVNYQQPNAQAIALNRVIGNSRSEIYGNLNANGKVFLINQNGILFGRNAQINVGGLLATTKNMSDEDFMNEQYHLLGNSASEIINQGNLHAENGAIVLAADTIKNTGTITTPNGRVILAAGQQLNLSIDTFGDIQVGVTQSTLDALIENKGLIAADNGEVYLTARGKEMVNKNAINLEGVIQAKAGKVVIDGDNADDSGNVVLNNGRIDISNDGVENNGKAGSLTVIGKNIGLFGSSTIKADGKYGGGTVLIGGDYLGTGDIPHAQAVVMQKNASIEASATDRGKGGKVILWSDQYTGFFGNINAKGGENGGDGGFVETSSKNKLSVIGGRVDAGATDGATGKWLLDPGNVTIGNSTVNTSLATQTAPDISTASGVKIWEGNTSTDSVVLDTDINNALNADTDVEIKTGAGDYDINVLIGTNISKTVGGAANLTLNASNDIIFEAGTGTSDYIYINSSSGALNIDLQAAGEVSIPGNNTVSFKTNNGDLTVNAANVSLVGDMSLPVHTVMTLNVGTGQANITASDTFSLGYLATSTNDFALNLTTIGNINFTGGKSLYIMNTSAISQDGTLLLKALNERGLTLGGSSSWNATQNSLIHFQGHTNHTRGEGVTLSSPGMTTYGDISITGTSNTGVGVIIYSSINMNNGTVNITGESTSDDGINIKGVHLNGNNQTYINIDGTTSNSTASGVKISRSSITSGGLNITARNNTANTTNASALHFVRDDARYDDSINVLNGGNLLIALNGSAFFGHNKTNVDGNITLIGHKSTSGVAADIDFSAEYDTLHANGLGGINIDTDGNITDMRRMNATAGDIKVVASGNLGFDDNRLHANASGNITLVAGNGTAAGTTDGITGEIQNVDKVLLSSTGTGRTINLYTGGHSLSAANTSVLNDMRVALSNQMTGSINYNAAYGATPGNASSTLIFLSVRRWPA